MTFKAWRVCHYGRIHLHAWAGVHAGRLPACKLQHGLCAHYRYNMLRPSRHSTSRMSSRKAENNNARFANPLHLARNVNQISWFRSSISVLAALVAGIAGASGLHGVIAYIVAHLCSQALLFAALKGKTDEYIARPGTTTSLLSWLTEGVGENVLPYLVVWSFTYAVVYFF